MDGDQATRFVASLVKSIQALCNGYIEFSSSIEVIGHIHLNIDRSVKLDYVLTEEVSKSISEGATVFASHSYHSHPPSNICSKNSNDSSKSNRQKQSVGASQSNETDPLGFSSSLHHVSSKSDSHSHARTSGHFGESSDSSHTDNFIDSRDTESLKLEKSRTSFQIQESPDRRRKSVPSQSQSHRTASPAAKRSRHADSNPEDFEVVEIKEEPDDEPAVFFGDSSSHMAGGQDLQTPDFSSVVMESLDRVGQVEGTKLVASGDGVQMQQPPFPVMMHSNAGMSSSSVSSAIPGPSLSDPQAQSLASTSGASGGDVDSFDSLVPSSLASLDFIHHASEQVEVGEDFDLSDLALHTLEKGEGKNHRCIVCQRRHSQYLKDHPGTHATNNPFKRSKTSFRCAVCKVYLCAQEERHCWWVWHQTLTDPSQLDPIWPQTQEDDQGKAALRRQLAGYKFYSQEDIAKAVDMVHEGSTLMEADKVTGEYMSRPLRRYMPGGYRRYKKADVDKAIKLVHEGATFSQAGTATRVPPSSIRRVLLKCAAHPGPCRGAVNRPGFQW